MDLLLVKTFVTLVVPFLLGALAHKLLSEWTTSAPIPPSAEDCEAFLSCADTRKGFADRLYRSLVGVGIRVFRDHDELRTGEKLSPEVLKAIENSKILIPIISENYASCKSCLDQLVHMMERQKHSGRRVVFPIFYKVKPADVRRRSGSFGGAFRYYGRSFDPKVVIEWKKALAEVSELTTGWESERVADGREGELVKLVVRQVSQELKKEYLVGRDYLVGIDSRVDEVMKLIDKSSGGTLCVGIYGMVGIGKTTLVKAIYKKLSGLFYRSSFIEDIRESCNHNGIVYLQNQLIANMLGADFRASDIQHGIMILTSVLKNKKVLLILDDVDNTDQLNALAGMSCSFAPGSRIFVTSRNESVLDWARVGPKYKLKEMNEEQSLILFSRHAFRRDFPPNGFPALAHIVVSMMGGLPLALKVAGSFLCGKPAELWRETIEKMKNLPHRKVQEKLMIGYCLLEEEQRQMFLDIACFLIGSDERIASYMWDACGFFSAEGIEVLRSSSFIKIGDNHELSMQNQMRDLGRKIVLSENRCEPHQRSRLWDFKEALEVLEKKKGSELIRAVCLEKGNSTGFAGSRTFTPEQFIRSPKLRFLHMSDVKLTGDFRSLFSELRWLKWGNCPSNFEATNLQTEALVILDLSGSKISDKWQGWPSMMMAKELKVLNLTGCRSLKSTSYLSAFKRLEILILRDCSQLKGIDPCIGDMMNLVSLDLRGCSRLKGLPPQMAKLGQLEELHLDGTAIQEIPSFISSLRKLKTRGAS